MTFLLIVLILTFLGVAQAQTVNPRFVIQGDLAYDKMTDLTWQRCSVGQTWKEGTGCEGEVKTFTFNQAQNLGGSTWRVPTRYELGSLIDPEKANKHQQPTIDETVFPNMDGNNLWYWTSTPIDDRSGWGIYFKAGFAYTNALSKYDAVRLVRNGK